MQKTNEPKEKKDYFTVVMITQGIVCAIIAAIILISLRSGGTFAEMMKAGYLKFMTTDFTEEEFSEAFRTVLEYAEVFAPDNNGATAVFSESDVSEAESSPELPTGGKDLEFSSLETLEGVCLENVDIDLDMQMPLKDYEITSAFGYRVNPVTGNTGIHTGLDLAAPHGSPIYAAADGEVVDAAYDGSYGNYVKIKHENSVVTIYAHCSELFAREGETVKAGEKIAAVGSTGDSTGNHLHFEVRKENIRIDPEYILFGDEDKT